MAIDLEAGDILSFHIEGDVYGLARVLRIEGRSGSNLLHLEIYDTTLDAGPGAQTPDGDWVSRTHDLPDIDALTVAIDHLAITTSALAESDPVVVDYREVVSADLVGYRAFIGSMREHFIKQGMLRNPTNAEEDVVELEEDDDDDEDGEFVGEEPEEDDNNGDADDGINPDDDTSDDDDDDDPGTVTVELMPWHIAAFDMPIPLLARGWTDILTEKGGEEGGIIEWLGGRWSGNNIEEINALVEALLGGDYGAGHELMIYGDGGVEALAVHLNDKLDLQQAEDIINILADAGSIKGYEAIAEFFLTQNKGSGSPLSIVASRGFCYAVMRTGGVPEALHQHLDKLDTIVEPELIGDVIEAREAIAQAEKARSADEDASSSNDSTDILRGKSFGDLGL